MKHIKSLIATAGAAITLLPYQVLAASSNPFEQAKKMTGEVGSTAKIDTGGGLTQMVGNLINVALGFLGIVFLVLMLYAGFLWMTAQGDDKKVSKAKDMIIQAVIGLVIIVAAYAITGFVMGSIFNATTAT